MGECEDARSWRCLSRGRQVRHPKKSNRSRRGSAELAGESERPVRPPASGEKEEEVEKEAGIPKAASAGGSCDSPQAA